MRSFAPCALVLGACASVREAPPDPAHVIWLDHPATHFTSALPLGNGTMGALVFGGVDRERVVLNEIGLWSGSLEDPNRHDSHEYLPEIRRLLLEGQNLEAEKLLSEHFTCAGAGSGQGNGANVPYGCYQTLGDLWLEFPGGDPPGLIGWRRAPAGASVTAADDGRNWPLVDKPDAFDVLPFSSALFRCSVDVTADWAARARTLDFSPIDDEGEIVLNGEILGRTDDGSRPFSFDVRGKLHAGANLLLVRVANKSGDGHMAHEVSLRTSADDYRNELDLRTGIVRTSYVRDGVRIERECFVSKPHEVFVERIRSARPGGLSFALGIGRQDYTKVSWDMTGKRPVLLLEGRLPSVSYAACVTIQLGSGRFLDQFSTSVEGADWAVIRVASATSREDDAKQRALEKLERAELIPYEELRRAHVEEQRRIYDRCALEPPSPAEVLAIPTDKRLERLEKGGDDPALAALDFHYGRYLLMSSSRPGGLPANLQGLWAEETQTPWNGDYHLDINVQMNYWPAEVANLAECHEPLFDLIDSLRKPGAATAKAYYDAPGWVAHVITNVWGFSAPGEDASWGSTLSGGAWLADHLWEHYDFGRDKAFLARAYPAMKESAQFYRAILIEEPKHHWLVSAPSNSPEHGYVLPDGRVGHTCMGPTIDQELVRELFGNVIEASRILGVDPEFRADLEAARARLAPVQVGAAGDVQEWLEDYKGSEPHSTRARRSPTTRACAKPRGRRSHFAATRARAGRWPGRSPSGRAWATASTR